MNAVTSATALQAPSPSRHAPQRTRRSSAQELQAILRLASYLGPWRSKATVPADVGVREVVLECAGRAVTPILARVYTPTGRRPIGSYLLSHGLNPQGPYDPRFDRFARVLAHAGFVVVSPELPGFRELLVQTDVADTFTRACRAFLQSAGGMPWGRPGVFGISFGSFPALVAAGTPDLANRFGGVVTFGGYGDFHRTLRFALGVRDASVGSPAVDRTCLPAVYLNLLPALASHLSKEDQKAVAHAIREFIARTWGKVAMKSLKHSVPVAVSIASQLTDAQAQVYRLAVGLEFGGVDQCVRALQQHDEAGLDPREAMAHIRCPAYFIHAADDDVIPCAELGSLADALPDCVPVQRYLTGLYDHGGQACGAHPYLGGRKALQEAVTMAGMLRAIVRGGTDQGGH